MIHSVTVTNYLGESIEMELRNPEKSGLLVSSIDGLGPVKADIKSMNTATYDGAVFSSAKMGIRNVTIGLIFMWSYGIEKARHLTYKMFPLKKEITIAIRTDDRNAYVKGYVESNNPNIFSSREGCQISIVCTDPYFYSVNDPGVRSNAVSYGSIEPLFCFEEVKGERGYYFFTETSGREFSRLSTNQLASINYTGDIGTGIEIEIYAEGEVVNPVIFDVDRNVRFKVTKTMKAGDRLLINTVRGNKYVKFITDGSSVNAMQSMDRASSWLTIEPGLNRFGYFAEKGMENMRFTVRYDTLYEGV